MKHRRRVQGEQVIALQVAQQLKILILYQDNYFAVSAKHNLVRDRLTVLIIQIKFNLLQILKTNSVNVKHQGKSSNQLEFHLSAYTHL